MQCGAFLVREERRRKGSGATYQKIVDRIPREWVAAGTVVPPADATVCTGQIQVSVQTEGVGCCSECYTEVIVVSYKCRACGNTVFPSLPDCHALDDWITAQIAAMPDPRPMPASDLPVNPSAMTTA